mmetsp:Transcript_49006/g.135936  ORF Transcript_49006/g.135936 Transcript_49006/m.135936 type:complete len:204 (-) Transcript_49006:509-1120(-)
MPIATCKYVRTRSLVSLEITSRACTQSHSLIWALRSLPQELCRCGVRPHRPPRRLASASSRQTPERDGHAQKTNGNGKQKLKRQRVGVLPENRGAGHLSSGHAAWLGCRLQRRAAATPAWVAHEGKPAAFVSGFTALREPQNARVGVERFYLLPCQRDRRHLGLCQSLLEWPRCPEHRKAQRRSPACDARIGLSAKDVRERVG